MIVCYRHNVLKPVNYGSMLDNFRSIFHWLVTRLALDYHLELVLKLKTTI